jgi:hypothetical protein
MMTDTSIQQATDTNGQTLVTQSERQALIQKLYEKVFFFFKLNFIELFRFW